MIPNDIPNTIQSPTSADPAPDRGSGRSALIAWVLAAVAFLGAAAMQRGWFEPKPSAPSTPVPVLAAPASGDPLIQSAKMMVRLKTFLGSTNPSDNAALLDFVGKPGTSKVEKLRYAIITAELAGADAARKELDALGTDAPSTDALSMSAEEAVRFDEQVASVRAILSGQATTLTSEQRESLTNDHGYLGKLILTHGLADQDPSRAPLVEGGGWIILLSLLIVGILIVGGLGGLTACITFFVRLGSGKIKPSFSPPTPGGSVYLETAALFFGSFLLLQLITHLLFGPDAINIKILSHWILLLVPLWPIARGVAAPELRHQLGLHTGKGFWREVGAGIFAYFATIPFIFIAAAIALFFVLGEMHSDPNAAKPNNPIQELIGQGEPITLLLVFVLATVWAPLMEEMIFRGALFRHLRGRLSMIAAATISALVFGFMHAYPLPLLLPIITLGFSFALMREWRGSLIAPMVGHFLHNATLLSLGILIVQSGK